MVSVACFGVSVSVIIRLMFVHYTFSLVWVTEWPPFGEIAARSVGFMFSLSLSIRNIYLVPVLFLRAGFQIGV